MVRRARIIGALVVCLSVGLAPALWAQDSQQRTRGLTVGASGGLYIVGGDDFSGTDDALGVDAYIGYRALRRLDVNLGIHYSNHGIPLPDRDLSILAVYAEPRLLFPLSGSSVVFALGIRAGWVRRESTSGTSSLDSTGYGVGAVAAVQYGVARSLNLEAVASFNLLSFAPILGNERDTGSVIGLQVGLSVPLPGSDF